ncbi:Predicted arabinose efflux permease, MFS family [Halovenus aranensis]|jgi:MFS family permease|uniref:Predicted arabinose efflux permease, MFS family n=2 Tax=Halovenus aranensis TaxID=890420 RepID=A0A1G8WA12_9EURY|nr:Predicted arabinose efflux permease, MFS family [Halovenus aranensis]
MVFFINLARLIFAPLVQPAASEFEVTAASLGVVTSAAWLGSASPRLPTGYLLTRYPRHYIAIATGMLLVCTSLFTAYSQSVVHLTAGAFLMGLSSGMYYISVNPLISELFPDRVGTALGVHGTAAQVAAVGAPLFVSAILVVGDWRTTFLLISGLAGASTLGLVVATRRTEMPEAGAADRSLVTAGKAQWRLVLTGVVFIGVTGFLWNGLFNLYGDYLDVAKGIDAGTGRLLLSLMFAAGIPAFLVTGRLADRVPNVPLIIGIISSFSLFVFVLTLVEGLVAVAVLSVLIGYAIHSLFPAMDTYMLSSLPDEHRGSAYALFSATMMLIQALGSGAVGTAVTRGFSYDRTFQTLSVLAGIVVTGMALCHRSGYLPTGGNPGNTPDGTVPASDD